MAKYRVETTSRGKAAILRPTLYALRSPEKRRYHTGPVPTFDTVMTLQIVKGPTLPSACAEREPKHLAVQSSREKP